MVLVEVVVAVSDTMSVKSEEMVTSVVCMEVDKDVWIVVEVRIVVMVVVLVEYENAVVGLSSIIILRSVHVRRHS